nr:MAG TPA: hypothetical protein [Crassvirales sp.]
MLICVSNMCYLNAIRRGFIAYFSLFCSLLMI